MSDNLDCRCETCPDWLPPKSTGEEIKQRQCGCSKIIDMSDNRTPWCDLPKSAAGYSDFEGYCAVFRSGPSFCCVHRPNFTKLQAEVKRLRGQVQRLHTIMSGVSAKKLID
jgi:hypothetical protein